jgi:hypothetical protein
MPYNHGAMSGSARRRRELPPVDERLVMPESGIEILDGRVLIVPGADPPHAEGHLRLAYLLGAHAAPGFVAVVDMLTRTSAVSDFAPDASIYPEGPDPDTGGRRLELLAFEVVSKQSLSVPTHKARQLSARGVRRVFALVLGKQRALEWDRRTARWKPMHQDDVIDDPCLAVAIPVRALLDSARADEAVFTALEARRPDLVDALRATAEARGEARGVAIGEARGRATGAAETRAAAERSARVLVRDTCSALGISVTPRDEDALEKAPLEAIHELLIGLVRDRRWPVA